MLGRKLAGRLAQDGALGSSAISQLSLVDVAPSVPPADAGFAVETCVSDISEPGAAEEALSARPDVIFHLAAVVSGEAEADLDKGYRVNLDGTRRLLDAVREAGGGYRPRVVFASSIAVFGPPFPEAIGDDARAGAADELRDAEGDRRAPPRRLLAARVARRHRDPPADDLRPPGPPNRAASGFFSSIIREPLSGREAVLPVSEDVRHWFASPRAAVGFLVHAATLEAGALGDRRALTMPGLSATVAEQIAALREVGGEEAVRLIRREPDPTIMRIVDGWPRNFDTRRAHELGFRAETSFDEIIRVYLEDELVRRRDRTGDRRRQRDRQGGLGRPGARRLDRRPRGPPPRTAGRGGRRGRRRRCRRSVRRLRSGARSRRSSRRSGRSTGGSTCSSTTPASAPLPAPLEDLTLARVAGSGRHQPDRRVPVHAGGLPHHEGPVAAGRADHQQRLDLGDVAAAELRAVHGDEARRSPGSRSRPRSTDGSTTSPAGRSTSATPATELTERDEHDGRPPGRRHRSRPSRPSIRVHVAEAVVYMAGLPLDRERPVHDGDGHEDALRRPRLTQQPEPGCALA